MGREEKERVAAPFIMAVARERARRIQIALDGYDLSDMPTAELDGVLDILANAHRRRAKPSGRGRPTVSGPYGVTANTSAAFTNAQAKRTR